MPSHVFVGGTGRSGTTVVARLIGQYPRHHHVDVEAKVHCVPGGLVDVAEGRADPQAFTERVRNEWYFGGWDGGGRGLHWLHDGRHVDRMCERFLDHAQVDRDEACRLFLHDLLDPLRPADRDTIVEMTPLNAMVMPTLVRWLPLSQFVLTVRDGRDVVSSVLRQPWGPTTWDEGLQWWADGLLTSHRGRQEVGPDRVHVVHLEVLTGEGGDQALSALVDFLGVAESEGVRNYRRHRVNRDRANVGRWAADLDDTQRRSVDQTYQRLLTALADQGMTDLLPIGEPT